MAEYKGASREGGRAAALMKKRELAREELEKAKEKIVQDNRARLGIMDNKFSSHIDVVEAQLKSSTVGLVTLDQMRATQESLVQEHKKRMAGAVKADEAKMKKASKKVAAAISKQMLSFGDDDEGEDENGWSDSDSKASPPPKKKKFGKDPTVDTSFLPDRDREELERLERQQLQEEWKQEQEKLKREEIEITYSYWDGSGHRRVVKMKKGDTISSFLQACVKMLRSEFGELRGVSVENLMYIKEDLIIPQHYTFYDFIVTKARGKSGPLFNFDVHEDVRMIHDAAVEKDESHAGKVVSRSWYERNKHIFPASRWEPYDPAKKWETYTISDGPKPK